MTVEGTLFALLPVGVGLSWLVTAILAWGAFKKPRITALTERAANSLLISVTITIYIWAVQNAAIGYPIPKEVFQVALRLPFLGFLALQAWFLWLYFTRRFSDQITAAKMDLIDALTELGIETREQLEARLGEPAL